MLYWLRGEIPVRTEIQANRNEILLCRVFTNDILVLEVSKTPGDRKELLKKDNDRVIQITVTKFPGPAVFIQLGDRE